MAKSNRIRIIGGDWRSRMLPFPEEPGLRPTPDRVRETLFNWLGQVMDGKTCLDLFAGSGALGFEALSRGARRVVMVERNARVASSLRANATTLHAENCELVVADALKFIDQEARRFDVIFVDPPYDMHLLPQILPKLPALLNEDGMVYAESDDILEVGPEWHIWRSGSAGQVHYYLLRKTR